MPIGWDVWKCKTLEHHNAPLVLTPEHGHICAAGQCFVITSLQHSTDFWLSFWQYLSPSIMCIVKKCFKVVKQLNSESCAKWKMDHLLWAFISAPAWSIVSWNSTCAVQNIHVCNEMLLAVHQQSSFLLVANVNKSKCKLFQLVSFTYIYSLP